MRDSDHMTETPSDATRVAVPNGRFDAEIARGAAYLDERTPDWRERIDLGRLILNDPHSCIIGQVYGNYYGHLNMAISDSDRHGFSAEDLSDEAWDQLTMEWREYIEATR